MTEGTLGEGRFRPVQEFAGFFRRIGASFIDVVILGFVGWFGSHFFAEQLSQYGQQARFLGLPFALAYFALGNSEWGGGTVGKRVLGIGVVNRDGQGISVARALLRALVYLVPFYVNGYYFVLPWPSIALNTIAQAIASFLVFGIVLGSVYLYLANWRTRQVVHDLAAGTFVVRNTVNPQRIDQHINPIHVAVIALLFLLSLVAMPAMTAFDVDGRLGRDWGVDFDALTNIQTNLNQVDDILSTGAQVSFLRVGGGPAVTGLDIIVVHRGRVDDTEAFADTVAARVLRLYPDALHRQKLTIIVKYGYDIGLFSNWTAYRYSHTPDEWRARLQQSAR